MKPSLVGRVLGWAVAASGVAALARSLAQSPEADDPGGQADVGTAERATQGSVPGSGSVVSNVVREVRAEIRRDNVTLSAAGLAFYGLIALVPALTATISVYGLVTDPAAAEQLFAEGSDALPDAAAEIVTDQLTRLASAPSGGLSFGLAVSLIGVFWTVSTAFQALIKGINAAYEQGESRSFAVIRLLAFGLALGAIVVVIIVATLTTVAPSFADWLGMSEAADQAIEIARWPTLAIIVMGSLAVLYRLAPDRPAPRRWWATTGALVATVLWGLASAGFSIYVSAFGNNSYAATYGTLAGVIILMLWLFMGGFSVLVGAEVNSVLERRRGAAATTPR